MSFAQPATVVTGSVATSITVPIRSQLPRLFFVERRLALLFRRQLFTPPEQPEAKKNAATARESRQEVRNIIHSPRKTAVYHAEVVPFQRNAVGGRSLRSAVIGNSSGKVCPPLAALG